MHNINEKKALHKWSYSVSQFDKKKNIYFND